MTRQSSGTLAAAASDAEILAGRPEMGGLIEIPMGDTLRLHGEAAVGMRSRWLAGAEVQLHAMGQPKAPDAVTSIPMLGAHVSAVLKYRLP